MKSRSPPDGRSSFRPSHPLFAVRRRATSAKRETPVPVSLLPVACSSSDRFERSVRRGRGSRVGHNLSISLSTGHHRFRDSGRRDRRDERHFRPHRQDQLRTPDQLVPVQPTPRGVRRVFEEADRRGRPLLQVAAIRRHRSRPRQVRDSDDPRVGGREGSR